MFEDSCVASVAAALEAGRDPQTALEACTATAAHLDPEGKRRRLAALGELIRNHPAPVGGRIAVCAGTIVECGADPADFPVAVFEKLAEMLDALPREAATEAAERDAADSDGEPDPPEAYFEFEVAAIACLARSARIRREQRARLWPRVHRYTETYGFLGKMLSMLEEEPLTVIDVPTGRAWRVVINGIADNFQLHTLLIGALAEAPALWWRRGRGGIAGGSLDPRIVAASARGPAVDLPTTSDWQLANWQALEPGGRLEPGHEHWIWNEGVPADIDSFEGVRIVLVAPTTIARSWNSGRVFPMVEGSLRVERLLDLREATELIERILARKRAGVGAP